MEPLAFATGTKLSVLFLFRRLGFYTAIGFPLLASIGSHDLRACGLRLRARRLHFWTRCLQLWARGFTLWTCCLKLRRLRLDAVTKLEIHFQVFQHLLKLPPC